MSNDKKSDTTTEKSAKAKPSTVSSIQAKVDQENEQGFRGIEVDPTPNENYTVAGVVSGKPTPETDPATAKEARAFTNVGLTGIEASARDKEAAKSNAANTRTVKRGEK